MFRDLREGEEEIKERDAKKKFRRQERTFPQVFFGQGCEMRRTKENIGEGMKFLSTRRAEGPGD